MKKLFTTIKVSSHGMSQTNHDSKKTTKRLLLSVALTITSLMSLAYDFSSESIYYTITSSSKPYTVAVTKGAGYGSYSGSVTIPVEVTYNGNNYSVTSIATNAFALCSVTTVNLPSSLITIEESAFQNSGLTDISISASVSNINSNAFYNCTKLSTITVDAANTNYCSENGILFNANKTTLVRYPIKKSGNSYPVPSSVTNIGDYAFEGCIGLTDITLPSSIVTIGNYAFSACTKLVSINLPSSLVTIGDYAFAGCTVASLSIPPSVTHFGEFAFLTTKFKTISIPESITEISNNSFKSSSLTSISIPTSVTKIGVGAFFMSDSLTSVTLTSSLKTIEEGAFSHCISLPSLTIPNSVTNLGNGALEACFSLSEISIPSSVTSIGSNCFLMDEKLKKVTLNALTASIGERAFYGCSGLEEFNVYATNPYDLSSTTEVFYNIPTATCVLHVPTGSKALYKAAAQWKNFTNIVDDLPVVNNTPTLSVSTSNISFLATPNKSIQITLNTNTTWTAISDQTWLTISPSSGTNDATVSLYATANTGLLRTAQISITATGVSPKTIIVTQEAGTTITQQIPLEKGWNLVSVNLLPDNAGGQSFSIATLFTGLAVETIKTVDSFWTKDQTDAFNKLKSITAGEGYLVKMSSAGTLAVTGFPMKTEVTVPQQGGWQLIGCPYQTSTALANILNTTNCSVLKNFDGFWQPAGTLNSIQSIEPGKAYFIKK